MNLSNSVINKLFNEYGKDTVMKSLTAVKKTGSEKQTFLNEINNLSEVASEAYLRKIIEAQTTNSNALSRILANIKNVYS